MTPKWVCYRKRSCQRQEPCIWKHSLTIRPLSPEASTQALHLFPGCDYHILNAGVNARVLEFGSSWFLQYCPPTLLFVLFQFCLFVCFWPWEWSFKNLGIQSISVQENKTLTPGLSREETSDE